MYPVSEEYKRAVAQDSRKYYYTGTITTLTNKKYEFGERETVKGSAYVTNKIADNELKLGSVYAAEFSATLQMSIDRYSLSGATIDLTYHLITASGDEPVPAGVFEIAEADRNLKNIVIKAYDYMLRFDKSLGEFSTTGKLYDLLLMACEHCSVELGMTEAELKTFPNGDVSFYLYSQNDIETWRDLLHYISQAAASFCYIDRYGRLILRRFCGTEDAEITWDERFNSSYSDFETRYTAVKLHNLRNNMLEYHGIEQDDGLTMDLEDNPFLQFEDDKIRANRLDNILQEIVKFSYVPFASQTIGNPAIDLGDVICFSGGHADASKLSCVTYYNYKLYGKHELKGTGTNPRLIGVKSKTDRDLSNLQNSIKSSTLMFEQYINAKEYTLGKSDTEIVYVEFVTTNETSVEFKAIILLSITVDLSAVLTAKYYMNEVLIDDFVPMQTVFPGKFILNLYYPMEGVAENHVNTFRVLLSIDSGSAVIGRGQARATISGQGFASRGAEWNGNLDFEENIGLFSPAINFISFKDEMKLEQNVPHENALEEAFGLFSPAINFVGFTAEPSDEVVIRSNLMDTFSSDSKYVISDAQSVRLKTQYVRTSTTEEINTGALAALDLSSEWRRIDSVAFTVTARKEAAE